MLITNTPQQVADGTVPILITPTAGSTGKTLLYGFGDVEPTTWHIYKAKVNEPLVISTSFGKVWLKAVEPALHISMTTGL